MTSEPMRDPRADPLLTPHNAALVMIDAQPGPLASVTSMDRTLLVDNLASLAKTAKLFRLPVVLSTLKVKTGKNQPTIHQLTEVFGEIPTYDRTTLNPWEDVEFLAAVTATGRKRLIMGGLWTDVCLAFPALNALRDGYEVYPVVDCCGSTSLDGHRAGIERMVQAGAHPVSWVSVLCELQRDWARTDTVDTFAKVVSTVQRQ